MAKRLVVVALLLAAVLNVQEADAFANGAPTAACGSLTPGHPSTSKPVPGGYFLYSNLIDNGGSYTAGKNYTRKLCYRVHAFCYMCMHHGWFLFFTVLFKF